ncbi:MAG: VOC family protein [Solirubrobacteraceae bacterium]|nr:VOC family protein [Solirubrobacteraceae bacterium]
MSALHHAGLELRPEDAEAEVAFWGLLGWTEVEPPAGLGERARWVERGGAQIHLLVTETPSVPAAGHVAVVAPDYDATIARLRAAGHEAAPRTAYWGAPRTQVISPAGHRVEVMAAPPAPVA